MVNYRANVGDILIFKQNWSAMTVNGFDARIGDFAEVVQARYGSVPSQDRYVLRLVKSGKEHGNWDLPDSWFQEPLARFQDVKLTDEEMRSAKTLPSFDELNNFFG